MEKQLTDMTTQELWELFPIILKAHNLQYKNWYAQQAEELLNILAHKDIYRMNHIGSTAVEALIAKPTVDILLEMNRGCDMEQLRKTLEEDGWLYMSGELQPEYRLVFNKGYTPQGFAEKVYSHHLRKLLTFLSRLTLTQYSRISRIRIKTPTARQALGINMVFYGCNWYHSQQRPGYRRFGY